MKELKRRERVEAMNPINLQHDIGARIHRYPVDLDILNEIGCFVIIYDFLELGKPKKLWANAPWLTYIGQTLDEFQKYDFSSNVSAPVKKIQYDVGQQVQIGRQTSNLQLSMYPVDVPLMALAMHQPLVVESREPLLLVSTFNSDKVTADSAKMAPPLDFHFKGNLCANVHLFPEGLELLNELPLFAVIYDFQEPASPKHLWGNTAWLVHIGKTLEEFVSSRFQLVAPARLHEEIFTLWQEVQLKRKTFSFETIIDCSDEQLRSRAVFRPIMFEGMSSPLVLCAYVPPDDLSSDQQALQNHGGSLFERQVMTLLDEGATIFDYCSGPRFGQAIWANFRNIGEYGVVYDCSELMSPEGKTLDLDTVLDSCVWSDTTERCAFVQTLRSLAFDSDPVVITLRKDTKDRREPGDHVWHQLSFSRCKNPYDGGDCLLMLESDVSTLMLAQAELQASNDLKDKFLQCMSHELRTPLNGIMGLSSAIVHSLQCPPALKTPLTTIDNSAKHLNSLVTDILETAECMAGNFRLHRAPTDRKSVV